jgi:exodeoxyribonuclease VII large subunit
VPDREELAVRLASAQERLVLALRRRVAEQRERLRFLAERPCLSRPSDLVDGRRQRVDDLAAAMERALAERLREARHRVAVASGRLDALSPLRVMGRGYAAVEKLPERRVVRAAAEVEPGDRVGIRFHDGSVVTRVEAVEPTTGETT